MKIEDNTHEELIDLVISLTNSDSITRCELVERGFAHYELVDDPDDTIREEIAKRSEDPFILSFLKTDASWLVRETLAKRGYFLDEFVYDEDQQVRKAVCETGIEKYNDLLLCDSHAYVRRSIARQGFHLKKLKDDHNAHVRIAVYEYIDNCI